MRTQQQTQDGEGTSAASEFGPCRVPMLWFSYRDLETELSAMIDRFEEKFGRKPTLLWVPDDKVQTLLGGFGLTVKEDTKLGVKEGGLE